MRLLTCLLSTTLLSGAAVAQQASAVSFTLDFPGQDPPQYRITVDADGQGEYAPSSGEPVRFQVSAEAAAKWMAAGENSASARVTEQDRVAFTGRKTVMTQGSGVPHSLSWTSPKENPAVTFTHMAEALALTIQFGQIFARDLRFDRIRLDKDMSNWQHMLKQGTASNPEAIASVLKQIADDPLVLARVRKAAETALAAGR